MLAPLVRKKMLGPEPFSRNSPTGKELIVGGACDFAREKERLLGVIGRFAAKGPDSAARYPHGFLGRMSGEDWGRMMAKHLDHHLTQFGA